jgi:TolA-binding protein
VEEDASEVAALQKKIRELEAKISELEEDLENERMARQRVHWALLTL